MDASFRHSQVVLLLATSQHRPYFHELQEHLRRPTGTTPTPTVCRVESIAEAEQVLQTEVVDAIVTHDGSDTVAQLQALRPPVDDSTQQPLMCVLTHRQELIGDLPPDVMAMPFIPPPFVANILQHHLSQRADLHKLLRHEDELTLLKNAIVRNVSHELRTPLLQVKSAVALIAEDMDADDKLAVMAVQSTARLEAAVKNITQLAASLNGTHGPVLIHESIDHAMRNLRRAWARQEAISRVQLEIEPSLPPVYGHKQGLAIALQQLIDNALKFSANGDTVVVRVSKHNDNVLIEVEDQGIGIADDKLKQIFESFYQIDSSTTRTYGGTGVGLAIVRLIMEKHSADIYVESTLGEGSTFSFELPYSQMN